MCSVCGKTPCHPRCPNAEELEIGVCANCFWEITAGFEYFTDDNDNMFCSRDCAVQYYGIKKTEYSSDGI